MKIAYLISAHTDPDQLKRLVEALHPDAEFFIHIDQKSDLKSFSRHLRGDNIHYIPNRVDVMWGTMVEVEYQINLLRAAVDHPTVFDRIFFLSGMDFPLWDNNRITTWLEQQQGRELLQGINMDTSGIRGQQREMYTVARPFSRNKRWAILQRKVLKALGLRKQLHFTMEGQLWHLYKGSAWWCISQQLAAYILDIYDNRPQVKAYFQDSFCPAETLIQTIAFNSPQWASKCILTEGAYPGLAALTPLHFIDYDPVIKVMDETDYDRLMDSGKMFCRKVVSGKSDQLVEKLRARS